MPKYIHRSTPKVPDARNIKPTKKSNKAISQRHFKNQIAVTQTNAAQIIFHGRKLTEEKLFRKKMSETQTKKIKKKVLTNMRKYGIIVVAEEASKTAQTAPKVKGKLIKKKK